MIVYLIKAGGYYKIGKTNTSIKKRLRQLQTGNPIQLVVVKLFITNNSVKSSWVERMMHDKFHKYRVLGEWFRFGNIDKVIAFGEDCLYDNSKLKHH